MSWRHAHTSKFKNTYLYAPNVSDSDFRIYGNNYADISILYVVALVIRDSSFICDILVYQPIFRNMQSLGITGKDRYFFQDCQIRAKLKTMDQIRVTCLLSGQSYTFISVDHEFTFENIILTLSNPTPIANSELKY